MALRPVGTKFVTKGFNTFVRQLTAVDRTYQKLGKTINLTGNNITAFGATLRVFNRKGKAYSQWVDDATHKFLSHDEVQKRFQSTIASSRQQLVLFGKSFNVVSLSKFGIALAALAVGFIAVKKAIDIFRGAISAAVKVAKAAVKPFIALGKAIIGVIRNIGDFFIGDALSAISSGLAKLKNDIVSTVSSFQRLEIQYESLIARQLRAADSTLGVAESLKIASKDAQNLLEWVKQIAVTTPFEVETIAKTIAFSQAMGFTVGESKAVTTAIINFTSAMGLGQETMERIIQNFGQMRAAGKVTGTELRDLARGALLPVNDIINRMGENLGVAEEDMDDFRDAAAEGKVPVDQFFKAFIDMANEDFPNAAERMSRTFEGVKNNIVDFFKTIVGVEALGPVFDRITSLMADALEKLLTPGVRQRFAIIGESLLQSFNQIWSAIQTKLLPALSDLGAAFGITGVKGYGLAESIAKISAAITVGIEKISEFINELAKSISGKFDELGSDAKTWGFNIIGSLAEGMAEAAKFVVQVLIDLGNIIAGWLMPGSPPKLLPELDKWGAAAMTEYMEGWLNADFSVFNDIAKTVESFVRSISGTILDKTKVIPTILEIRDALAQAMNEITKSGKVTEDTLKKVFGALSGGTPELRKYVELQIEVAEANAKVVAAQKELNEVTEEYDKILEPLKRRLDEISDAGADFDAERRISQLELIMADINASEGDKARARMQIEKLRLEQQIRGVENEKDVAVEAAEEKVNAAEETRDALEIQLEAQEALLKVQIDTNNLIKEQIELLEKLKDTSGKFEGLGIGGIGEEAIKRGTGGMILFKDKISQIFEEMKKNVGQSIDDILAKFDGLGDGVSELASVWGRVYGLFANSALRQSLLEISGAFGKVFASVGDVAAAFSDLAGVPFGEIEGGFAGIAIALVSNFFIFWLGVLNGLLQGLTESLKGLEERIREFKVAWHEFINISTLADFAADLKDLVWALWEMVSVVPLLEDILGGFWSGYVDVQKERSREVELNSHEHASEMEKTYAKMGEDVGVEVERWTEQTEKYVKDTNGEIIKNTEEMSDEMVGQSIIPDMVNNITSEFETLKDNVVGENGLFTTMLTDMLSRADTAAISMYDKGVDIVQGLWDGIESLIDTFLAWLQPKYEAIVDMMNIIGDMGSGSKVMFNSGVNLLKGLADGINSAMSLPVRSMEVASTMVMDAQPVAAGNVSNTTNNNFTLNMPTTGSSASVQRAFNVMSVMSR